MVIVTWVGKVCDVGRDEAVVVGGLRSIDLRFSQGKATSKDLLSLGEELGKGHHTFHCQMTEFDPFLSLDGAPTLSTLA